MRSTLGKQLRDARLEREARATPEERVRLALALGARDLRTFASARGITPREAYRALRRAAQAGRTPSGVMEGDEP